MSRRLVGSWFFVTILSSCLSLPNDPESLSQECRYRATTEVTAIPACLVARGVLAVEDRDSALTVLERAVALRDSFRADTAISSFNMSSEITRSLIHVAQMYSEGLLEDSARFHRLVDHVAVTVEYAQGSSLHYVDGKIAPLRTPYLLWVLYPSNGIFFQPVSTLQYVGFLFVRPNIALDSLANVGEAIWRYALWRTHDGLRFPVWEYEFGFNSGGVVNSAPWISGQAQGYVLITYAALYERTGDVKWRDRAYQVLNSYKVQWDDGGVMLPDTSHGYWFEEFSPYSRIWNGSAQALLGVGELWRATGDPEIGRIFDRGVEALKFYTPNYDTGSWTLYSMTQGYNSRAYHAGCIQILDALFTVSGDFWFKDLADRWRIYTPPPGVY